MTMKMYFFGLLMLAFALAFVWDDWQQTQPPTPQAAVPPLAQTFPPAPQFGFTTLDGQTFTSLHDLPEDTLYLNFWATWCTPCLAELPSLLTRIQKADGQAALIAIATDATIEPIQQFIARLPAAQQPHVYWVWDRNKEISLNLFNVAKVPETFILNAERRITRKVVGAIEW